MMSDLSRAAQISASWRLPSDIPLSIVELTVTYLLHSSILIGTAWLVTSSVWRRKLTVLRFSTLTEERLWKLVSILGLFTAPVSMMVGWSLPMTPLPMPWESRLVAEKTSVSLIADAKPPTRTPESDPVTLPQMEKAQSSPPEQVAIDEAVLAGSPRTDDTAIEHHSLPVEMVANESHPLSPRFSSPSSVSATGPIQRSKRLAWLSLVVICCPVVGGCRLLRAVWAMNRLLSCCTPLTGPVREEFERLTRPSSIRLLVRNGRDHHAEPFACGVWTGAIVVPSEIELRLSRDELRALLAHEIAHLARRDPLWLWISQAVCWCLPFQPLNWLTRRRWQEAAERLCDDWALNHQVSAISLANCLTKIAEWKLDHNLGLPGLAAMGRPGALTERVHRLLNQDERPERNRTTGQLGMTVLVFVLGGLMLFLGPRRDRELSNDDTIACQELWIDIEQDLRDALAELDVLSSLQDDDRSPEFVAALDQLKQHTSALQSRLAMPTEEQPTNPDSTK